MLLDWHWLPGVLKPESAPPWTAASSLQALLGPRRLQPRDLPGLSDARLGSFVPPGLCIFRSLCWNPPLILMLQDQLRWVPLGALALLLCFSHQKCFLKFPACERINNWFFSKGCTGRWPVCRCVISTCSDHRNLGFKDISGTSQSVGIHARTSQTGAFSGLACILAAMGNSLS